MWRFVPIGSRRTSIGDDYQATTFDSKKKQLGQQSHLAYCDDGCKGQVCGQLVEIPVERIDV